MSSKRIGLGPIGCQPPSSGPTMRRPRQGASVDALRPAWASWMPGTAPCAVMKAAIGANAAPCSADHRPESSGLIRPSGETAVASTMTSPAPPTARLPRWTRCQSVGKPSLLEYWHIGETKMRLRNSTPRSARGLNSRLMGHEASRTPAR